ncbi:MAG: hypothetical protein HDS07_08670 [Bacteroides sp.]|nr:hypothetical protein [Bacteroides sp.]
MKKVVVYLLSIVLVAGLVACDSHGKEIDQMKKSLLNSSFNGGKEGTWVTEYPVGEIADGVSIDVVKEYLTLKKDDTFKELSEFYFEGRLMATCELSGKWDIKYDGDYEAFFFDQVYNDDLKISNVNFSDQLFKTFDIELRIVLTEDSDDSDVQIIDCSPTLFLLKDIEDGETLRYEPAAKNL